MKTVGRPVSSPIFKREQINIKLPAYIKAWLKSQTHESQSRIIECALVRHFELDIPSPFDEPEEFAKFNNNNPVIISGI